MSLGLTDGSLWGGLQPWSSNIGVVANINSGFYNVAIGTTQTGTPFTGSKAIGVTETEGKSGLKVVRDPNIIMIIKY